MKSPHVLLRGKKIVNETYHGSAYSPGHVTGFFEIFLDSTDLRRCGSRGAGVCLEAGAWTEVELKHAQKFSFHAEINAQSVPAPVSENAIRNVLAEFGEHRFKVILKCKLALPLSQGFGMSGAGALSAALATVKALKYPTTYNSIVEAAHCAEVRNRTGLGDVVAQATGGFEFRREPGTPPFGFVERLIFHGVKDIVLCTVGEELRTREILASETQRMKICEVGRICIERFERTPSLKSLFALSEKFALETGLANDEIIKAIQAAKKYGMASMTMLGNSIFAVGKTKKLVETLSRYGKVYVTKVGGRAE